MVHSDGYGLPWLPLNLVILVIEMHGTNTLLSIHFVSDF